MRELTSNMPHPLPEELDQSFPVQNVDWNMVTNPPIAKIQVTWLGHASVLVQQGGFSILCDPVFSQRVSPVQFMGPKRYRPPPCQLQELCSNISLDVVLISHNHYDHLDYQTVLAIHEQSPQTAFCVPLGLAAWLRQHISDQMTLCELDWHEQFVYHNRNYYNNQQKGQEENQSFIITSVPVRHWSNRVGDRDKTLWCGYSIETTTTTTTNNNNKSQKFLFSGDTAWFDDMGHILGQRYGPFDCAAIPIGAYEPRHFMKTNHVNVEEAVRMKDAIGAKSAVPIHWGAFPLTTEPYWNRAKS